MSDSESRVGAAVGPHAEQISEGRANDRPPERRPAVAAPPRVGGGAGPFRIVKPGQGTRVRWGTAIGAGALAIAGAEWIWEKITIFRVAEIYYVRTLVPLGLLLLALYLIFWAVGRRRSVIDFMIATEGEMKKVNWSSRREVWGATRVVIVTVLALGIILAVVDAFFMAVFGSMGVLKNVRLFDIIFGTGEV